MATGNILAEGNTDKLKLISVTLSPALIVLNTTAEQTFTVPGLADGDWVFVNKPTAQAGLGIVGCRVTAANTLGITFSNNIPADKLREKIFAELTSREIQKAA